MSFFNAVNRQVGDIRDFLKAASGNSIKYSMEAGAKHMLYIPYITKEKVDENGNVKTVKDIVAISVPIHTWNNPYKAVACLKGVVLRDEQGNVINDGECPFCDRVANAWDIARYRRELEEKKCALTGEAREKHMKQVASAINSELKASNPVYTLYLLVVKFKHNAGKPVMNDETGLPDFELKIMKISPSLADKIKSQLENSQIEMAGASIMIQYDDSKNAMNLGQNRVISPIFPNAAFVQTYPGLKERIDKEVAEFKWDGIDKVFTELEGMSSQAAKEMMDESFKKWDEYVEDKKTNPNAQYLEYITQATNNPGMDSTPSIPNIPNIPNLPNMGGDTGAGAGDGSAIDSMFGGPGVASGAGTPWNGFGN